MEFDYIIIGGDSATDRIGCVGRDAAVRDRGNAGRERWRTATMLMSM
jgi:hypothetical protein